MSRTTPLEYLAGVLALETQLRAPVLDWNPELPAEQEYPGVKDTASVRAVPARDRLTKFITKEQRDYFGREIEDGYITATKFAAVMDCSHDTALRWLERFEEAGILSRYGTGKEKMYSLRNEFAEIHEREGGRDYKTDEELVEVATELVQRTQQL